MAGAAPSARPACTPFLDDGAAARGTLNEDPFNVRAEEQALQECTAGAEVRRVWSELEMVRSFGGHVIPGTPDGMFERWDGSLTCVQVVRVPIVVSMSAGEAAEVLAGTILTKVVKSQQWLRNSHVSPEEFIIFCWLPHPISEETAQHGRDLIEWVQQRDARFSLRLRLPSDTSALFPALFAHNHESARKRCFAECDVSTFAGYLDSEEEEESDGCEWDITWGWADDFGLQEEACKVGGEASEQGSSSRDRDEDPSPQECCEAGGEASPEQCSSWDWDEDPSPQDELVFSEGAPWPLMPEPGGIAGAVL